MTTENTSQSQQRNKSGIGEESILKVTKEIAIKFIEIGRVTPASFDETFKNIYATIKDTVDKG